MLIFPGESEIRTRYIEEVTSTYRALESELLSSQRKKCQHEKARTELAKGGEGLDQNLSLQAARVFCRGPNHGVGRTCVHLSG